MIMELFIQIRDGQPYEHPIIGSNFRQAFPRVDVNNLPPQFARFERIPQPKPGVYEVIEGVSYQWVDGIVKDVWAVRPMTDEERQTKVAELTQQIQGGIESLKVFAQSKLDEATDETIKQVWTDYLAQLDAYVIVDPANPQIPLPPRFNPDGTVLTTTAPGTAPDVTG